MLRIMLCLLALAVVISSGGWAFAGQSAEAEEGPIWLQALDNDLYKISLNVRPRMEFADQDGFKNSEAYTMRTRLGIGTKPFRGFSGFAEMENIFAIDDDDYFDAVSNNENNKTTIADPTDTELNQLFLKYQNTGEHPFPDPDEGGVLRR